MWYEDSRCLDPNPYLKELQESIIDLSKFYKSSMRKQRALEIIHELKKNSNNHKELFPNLKLIQEFKSNYIEWFDPDIQKIEQILIKIKNLDEKIE